MMKIKIVLAAAVVFLGIYSLSGLDENNISVNNIEYESGDFVYSGDLINGAFSGLGTISFENGGKFSGVFSGGRFDGEGVYNNNWSFKGIFEQGRTNKGTFYLENEFEVLYDSDTLTSQNWRFTGNFNERGQNGTGSFVFEDGSVYTGSFINGLADGEGVYYDAAGTIIYTGSFKDGLFDGQGAYYSPKGWSYAGSFKDGLFDGEGSVINGGSVIRGIWKRGVQITRYED